MKIFKKIIYYTIQFTWGILENIIGFLVFLVFISNTHDIFRNTFRTKTHFNGSFSIGNFIFINSNSNDYLNKHEYGHCLQNLYFGPFSLFIFKIPSLIHYWICAIKNDFSNYYSFYPEKYANILGGNELWKR